MKINSLRTIRKLALGASFLLFALSIPLHALAAKTTATGTAPKEEDTFKINMGLKRLSNESKTCASCHKEKTPAIYGQWGNSKHFGANVGCYECHKAEKSDKDAIMHKDFVISPLVSPKDCGECHKQVVKEFDASHHASAGNILGSLDNVLAEVVEGSPTLNGTSPVTTIGCGGCHGTIIRVNSDGTLDPSSWPNTGVGRINPDGSKGSCSACHLRHNFDSEQARHPDNCGRCHLGPDHPQKEIYEESAHGVAFRAHKDKMNMDSAKWVVGEDYTAAPTCATCHMSATPDLPITHDIGARISWNLRAPISTKIDAKAIKQGKKIKPWLERRKDMKNVCQNCHATSTVDNHFQQLDAFVENYNNKFAIPTRNLIQKMLQTGLLDKTKFNEEVEWKWFLLWHHEGRRARHGAAMFAPDYAHWEGMFVMAERFYHEIVPSIKDRIKEAREEGNIKGADEVEKLLNETLESPLHRWYLGKKPPKFWRPIDDDNHGFKVSKSNPTGKKVDDKAK